MNNDAEHLVTVIDGKRYYEGKYLPPSVMLWRCTTPGCTTPPKPQRRGQYKDKTLCNACSNRLKAQDPDFLKRRGEAISASIQELGDKWSEVAKKNNSDPETRRKISDSMKEYISENKEEALAIRKETALKNNEISGFGTKEFGVKVWADLSSEEREGRIEKAKQNSIEADKKEHVRLMTTRYPGFHVVEFGYPDNIYRYPKDHTFAMRSGNFLKRGNCPICSPKSQMEVDFHRWLSELVPDMKTNKRVLYLDDTKNGNKALEIDCYSDVLKFGVELHGLFYHRALEEGETRRSEFGVSKDFHKQKAELADKHGIKLLQFFEDEVMYKNEIVKSIISAKLGGRSFDKVYARECSIKVLNTKECDTFLDDNHLQDRCRSFLRLGLFDDTKLVSALTFRNKRDMEHAAEIARYCNLLNSSVIGGFSKLLKEAERILVKGGYKKILTYSDRRYSGGEVYCKNGFSFVKFTEPDMFWVKDGIRYARQISWGKTNEDMVKERYAKVYGTGHSLWEKNLT